MPIRTLHQRKLAEQLCVTFEVENKILCLWLDYMHSPHILAEFFSSVITLYIAIVHTSLPIYIYVFFPLSAASLMGFVFVIGFDQAGIIKTMNAATEPLLDSLAEYLRVMPKEMRVAVMKRAKALQPVSHSTGGFGKFSLSVSNAVWEEVLNQLLFLLSL